MESSQAPVRPKEKALWICFGLLLLIAVVYFQTRSFPLVNFDDLANVTENPHVTTGLSVKNIRWAFSTYHVGHWAPLTWISFQIDATIFHLNPGIMHLENAALHAISTLLIFALLNSGTGKTMRGAVVAAIFAVHPLHVESVAWITERRDMLSGPPLFASLVAYAFYTRATTRRTIWYFISLLFFAVSLLAKATAVTLPILLLLLDFWPLERIGPIRNWKSWSRLLVEKIPFALISAGVSFAAFRAQSAVGAALSLVAQPLSARLGNMIVSDVRYLQKFFCPIGLGAFYPLRDWSAWQVAVALLLLLAITAVLIWTRKPSSIVGWLWFLIVLLPVSGLFQSGPQAMADRYMYIPMIGPTIAVVWWFAESRLRRWSTAATLLVLLPLTILAYLQVQFWSSSWQLRSHALALLNEGADLHIQLAALHLNEGDRADAEKEYVQAAAMDPVNFIPEFDLGNLLSDDPRRAMPHYLRAAQLHPHSALVENNLAVAQLRLGQIDEAVNSLRAAIADDPGYVDARANLEKALRLQGRNK